jgi:hypothetical protein
VHQFFAEFAALPHRNPRRLASRQVSEVGDFVGYFIYGPVDAKSLGRMTWHIRRNNQDNSREYSVDVKCLV